VGLLHTVTLAAVALAVAGPQPRPLGTTTGGVTSDGARYLAFMSSEDVMRVVDMRDRGGNSLPTVCTPVDGAYGRLLLSCTTEDHILRARSGRSHVVRQPERFRGNGFYEMGRHWLRGELLTEDFVDATFLNWRNGSTRRGFEDLRADLDRRRFRRKPSAFLEAEYLGSSGSRDLYCRTRGERHPRHTLVLRRPTRVLQRSRGFCPNARLRRGVATWEWSDRVYAHVLRTGRTFRWRGSDPEHTRGWIAFVRRGRVLYARLP
jgi:hypothetical protein